MGSRKRSRMERAERDLESYRWTRGFEAGWRFALRHAEREMLVVSNSMSGLSKVDATECAAGVRESAARRCASLLHVHLRPGVAQLADLNQELPSVKARDAEAVRS